MLELATNMFKLAKNECLMVGDMLENDISMAKSFGIDSVLVLTGEEKNIN